MQQRVEQENNTSEYDRFIKHPYNVMFVFVLVAIGVLFAGIMVTFIYSRLHNSMIPVRVPWLFFLSAAVLVCGSWFMRRAGQAYDADEGDAYDTALSLVLFFAFLFLFVQAVTWALLLMKYHRVEGIRGTSYLYLLSVLHFAHLAAGVPFLFLFLRQYRRLSKDPISGMVYFSDPEKRLRLRLLSIYWHFMDVLWLCLVLFFTVNWLI